MSDKITREIIDALRGGAHSAFDQVFVAYYGKVKYFINGLVRSDEDAEELAQDIFVKIWTNHQSLDPERSFSSYIYTMARNAAYNFLKHKIVETSYRNELPSNPNSDSSDEIVFAKEIQLLVDMTVAGMPEQRKTIYDMSRNKGVENSKIAQELNISKKTVENQLSLALREIKQVISMFLMFFF